jgi:hypothetical protein
MLLLITGCSNGPSGTPGTLRFGQIGEVRVEVVTPLRLGGGELRQVLDWDSEGPWELTESISYRGTSGAETVQRSAAAAEFLAGNYAVWISQMNDAPALQLFVENLDPALEPDCDVTQSTVTVAIRDEVRGEQIEWSRCTDGTFESLMESGAGPDEAAARVVSAAILSREYTLRESFQPAYSGSLPFATLVRSDDTPAQLEESLVLTNEEDWIEFWGRHDGSEAEPPNVDFETDVVIVGAVGLRREAGDLVEVRRVLTVGQGTRVELVERIPGDFCSPAELDHFPVHMVVVPAVDLPVTFNDVGVERVPCGR